MVPNKYVQRVHGPQTDCAASPSTGGVLLCLVRGQRGMGQWDGTFTGNGTLAEDGRAVFTNGVGTGGFIQFHSGLRL